MAFEKDSKCGNINILSSLGTKYHDKRPQNNDILIVQTRMWQVTCKQIIHI